MTSYRGKLPLIAIARLSTHPRTEPDDPRRRGVAHLRARPVHEGSPVPDEHPAAPALHPESAYACMEHPAEVLDRMTQLSKVGSVTVDRINAGAAQT